MNKGYLLTILGGPTDKTSYPDKAKLKKSGGAELASCQSCSSCAFTIAMKAMGAPKIAGVWMYAFPDEKAAEAWRDDDAVKPTLEGRMVVGHHVEWDQLDAMRAQRPALATS
jgi:hypothetical protein